MSRYLRLQATARGEIYEAEMPSWTDDELLELATLWPKYSVSEIVERLHRPRWAIRSKAKRLCLAGIRPHHPAEDAVNLLKKRRFCRARQNGQPKIGGVNSTPRDTAAG